MSRNGSGVYTLPAGNPVVTLTQISSTWANTTLSDIATELTNSIDKGGRTAPTANLPMAGYKHTGAGAAAVSGQYLVYGQASASLTDLAVTAGMLSVTRPTAGTAGYFSITNTAEATQHYIGADSGDTPNIGYYAMNWGTGSAQLDFRMGGTTVSETKMSLGHTGNLTLTGTATIGGNVVVTGHVTSANACVFASDGGTQTRSSTTFAIMNGFTTEAIDIGAAFASSTFTAPVAGTYFLTYSTNCEGAGGPVRGGVRPYKNGGAIAGFLTKLGYSGGTAEPVNISDSGYVTLAANDTVALYAQRVGGSVDCYFSESSFSIRLVQ